MKRDQILDTAKSIVTGQRNEQYGEPENNFALIAEFWSAYIARVGCALDASDVANMMCLFKLARITTGTATADSYIDLCGYAACGGELTGGKDNDNQ